jgi:hypothetical protein
MIMLTRPSTPFDMARARVLYHPVVERILFPFHVLDMIAALFFDFWRFEPTLAVQVEWGLHFE